MMLNLSYHLVVPQNTKCNTYCHEMFLTNWAFLKTLKKKINRTVENHITKILEFDGNFSKLEYKSKINISFYTKRNCPRRN